MKPRTRDSQSENLARHLPLEPRPPRINMSLPDHLSQLGLPTEFPAFFPPQLERYRRSISEGADAPDEYAVAYMIATAATAAGADVSACVQPSWYVRANMFLAIVGYKGSSKSVLAEKCFAPIVHREDELRDEAARLVAAGDADDSDDDEDEENDGDDDADDSPRRRRRAAEPPDPCLLVNDTTGPALLNLLEHNRRQILVNTDELSAQFARNTGGTDRQMWCELYDGHRRRRERVSTKSVSATLAAPYVNMIGSVQPELLKKFYNSQGDDGLVDRLLLVGDGVMREARWPRDADDPILNTAWTTAMARLLRIEELAADSINQQVESRFTPAASEVCKGLMARLNDLVVVLAVPNSQRGVVKKLIQHAVKLALLHRCLRWAAGEFGERGPLGDVDADDAAAARDATLFFLGRWLVWRKELRGGSATALAGPVGLARSAGEDPALQSLAALASGAQRNVAVIERFVRLLRARGPQPVVLASLTALQNLSDVALEELRGACEWLADNGHGEWLDAAGGTFRLFEAVSAASPRDRKATTAGGVA